MTSDISTLLTSELGERCYRGEMPDSGRVVVVQYAGRPPFSTMDDGPAAAVAPGLNVRVRHDTYDKAEALAWGALTALDGRTGLTAGTDTYLHIEARQAPLYLGTDESGKYGFSVNFDTIVERG